MAMKLVAQQSDGSGIAIVKADSPLNDKLMAEREEHLAHCITPKWTDMIGKMTLEGHFKKRV
jgi:hypothetical protein